MRRILACIALSLATGCAGVAPERPGAVIGPGGAVLSEADLVVALGQAQIVVLGEVHDNPVHHARQARLVRQLRPQGIAFEMVPGASEEGIQVFLAQGGARGKIGPAIGWGRMGWPDWDLYAPVFEAAAGPIRAAKPVIETRPIAQVARADLAPPIARDKLQPQPVIDTRSDVAPAQAAIPVIETSPVPRVDQLDEPVTEVQRQPRAVPQARNMTQTQPRPDVPRPAVLPVKVRESVVAVPTVPVPPGVAPVARSAPVPAPAVAPSVTAAPNRPHPQQAPALIAMPAPQFPVLSVDTEARRDYGQSVKRAVMQNMLYPPKARMRNWQGVTVVRIDLSPEGDVTQLVVAESSGKDVLDDAAVKMIRNSLPLPKPPQGLRTVTVPVVFRLQG